MAIIEIPEGTAAGDLKKSVKVRGLRLSSEKEGAAVFRNGSGAVFLQRTLFNLIGNYLEPVTSGPSLSCNLRYKLPYKLRCNLR